MTSRVVSLSSFGALTYFQRGITGALLAYAALAAGLVSETAAQDYPVKPVRFIVPFALGGGTDVLARIVAPKMSESLGRQVIVENRTGAGGNLATEQVAKRLPMTVPGPFTMTTSRICRHGPRRRANMA